VVPEKELCCYSRSASANKQELYKSCCPINQGNHSCSVIARKLWRQSMRSGNGKATKGDGIAANGWMGCLRNIFSSLLSLRLDGLSNSISFSWVLEHESLSLVSRMWFGWLLPWLLSFLGPLYLSLPHFALSLSPQPVFAALYKKNNTVNEEPKIYNKVAGQII